MAASKSKLWLELLILYCCLPLLVLFDLFPFPPLLLLFSVCVYALFICRAYLKDWNAKPKFVWQRDKRFLLAIGWRFGLLMGLIAGVVLAFLPENLFSLVKESPDLVVALAIFYPLVSVVPQEFLYRAYFFHRYSSIFPSPVTLCLVSAGLFSYLHIIYANWIALSMSFAGGLLFSYTYLRARSFFLVCLEHSLYGLWIFVVGLGDYFYINIFAA